MSYNPEVNDDALTGKVIGIAIDIHKELGPDHAESTYRDVLAEGIRRADLDCEVEHEVSVGMYGIEAGTRRMDLLVEEEVVLELKVVGRLTDDHFDQLAANVEATDASRGLLLNFGAPRLRQRRYAKAEWIADQRRRDS